MAGGRERVLLTLSTEKSYAHKLHPVLCSISIREMPGNYQYLHLSLFICNLHTRFKARIILDSKCVDYTVLDLIELLYPTHVFPTFPDLSKSLDRIRTIERRMKQVPNSTPLSSKRWRLRRLFIQMLQQSFSLLDAYFPGAMRCFE